MDFTALVAAVDASAIVGGLTAIAGAKIIPNVTRWGYNKVISWIK